MSKMAKGRRPANEFMIQVLVGTAVLAYTQGVTRRLLHICLILLLGWQALAEPYTLQSKDLSVPIHHAESLELPDPLSENPSQNPDPSYRPSPANLTEESRSGTRIHVPARVHSLQGLRPGYRTRKAEEEYRRPVDVTIVARQYFDHYKQKYRRVRRVETWIYKPGWWDHIIHCNRARYYYYDVYLDDLEPGDRFETRVTWEGGETHTIDQTITGRKDLTFYLDEPAWLEY